MYFYVWVHNAVKKQAHNSSLAQCALCNHSSLSPATLPKETVIHLEPVWGTSDPPHSHSRVKTTPSHNVDWFIWMISSLD